jgi:hypothetical protein
VGEFKRACRSDLQQNGILIINCELKNTQLFLFFFFLKHNAKSAVARGVEKFTKNLDTALNNGKKYRLEGKS